jgi:hypothetical protein
MTVPLEFSVSWNHLLAKNAESWLPHPRDSESQHPRVGKVFQDSEFQTST